MAEWKIVFDDEDAPHTECPHGHRDSIVEVDKSVRWNTLSLATDGDSAVASTGDGDWEFDSWSCTACKWPDNLDAPEGFEITDWI